VEPLTNTTRAEWAAATLRHFQSITGCDTLETAVVDLLANVLHLLDRVNDLEADVPASVGSVVSPASSLDAMNTLQAMMATALWHYRCEIDEDEP